VREVTGKPIRFMGVGEKTDALEAFHPDRMASRILGMGDVLSLVEEIEHKVSKDKTEKLAKKIRKGKGFDLSDLRDQLEQMMNMGGIASMLEKLPLPGNVNPAALQDQANEQKIRRQIAIINSMTPIERRNPKLLHASRKRRIAQGSGTTPQEINKLLKQYQQMQTMMKRVKKMGHKQFLARGLPPGILPR
jgi:signal recognition particle subunit SRP54